MPVLRRLPAWAREPTHGADRACEIEHAPMFYVPGVLKTADAMWLARAIAGRIAGAARTAADRPDRRALRLPGRCRHACASRGACGIPLFITIRGFENEFCTAVPASGRSSSTALRASDRLRQRQSFAAALAIAPRRRRANACASSTTRSTLDSSIRATRDAARAQLGIDPSQTAVVSVGHLISRKRHHVLIEAFARVRARLPDATPRDHGRAVVRAATIRRSSKRSSARSDLARHVRRFVGNVPPTTVATWLRAADVFALGTAREGCCNAVLEALARAYRS